MLVSCMLPLWYTPTTGTPQGLTDSSMMPASNHALIHLLITLYFAGEAVYMGTETRPLALSFNEIDWEDPPTSTMDGLLIVE